MLWQPACAAPTENTHLAFVSEYVRELRVNEGNRELADKEINEKNADRLAAMIRGGTRIVLALRTHVSMLEGMRLREPFANLPGNVAEFYYQKIEAHEAMNQMAGALMSGAKPGIDYGALAADAPKLTAMIEHIDRALFEATPLIFATLIEQNPDKNNKMSRLNITKAQRDELVRSLQTSFGKKLAQKDQNFYVSSATVLRDYLSKKGYKGSDEPR
jgi:hypothetical protein